MHPTHVIKMLITCPDIIKLNRIIKQTPAVTKVEECTSAETGVGAAIAAGNHAEKGTWALLVIAANNTINTPLIKLKSQ